jgi:WD40 repeat protein
MSSGGEGGSKRSHDGEPRPGSSSGDNKASKPRDETTDAAAAVVDLSKKSNGTDKKKGRPKNGSAESSIAPLDSAPLSVTAEEVNYLIYRYLQESGFVHSSFTFAHESLAGKLRPRNASSIPPGALVLFLQKGLQYIGMEEGLRRELRGGQPQSLAVNEEEGEMEENGRPVKKAKGIEGDDHSTSIGPDFSLLCPRALHTLKQKEPPIKLRVPPASAAAVIKAKMEMEEKIARERAALYGKSKKGKKQQHHHQVFYEEEEGVEEIEEEYPAQQKKKGKAKKKAAAEEDDEETLIEVANNAAISPKRRKKKKKAVEVDVEEEQLKEEEKPSAKKSKSNPPIIDVDEIDEREQLKAKTSQQQQLIKLQQQQLALHQQQQRNQQLKPQQQQQQEFLVKQRQATQAAQFEAQRLQEAHAQQQQQQQMFNANNRGAAPAGETDRGLPQAFIAGMDTNSEAAEMARQRAEIQAVLAQRQQAVLTGRGGVATGGGQQPQQGLQDDSVRASAIAALMASAAQNSGQSGGGGVNALPNAISSNQSGHGMNGKANPALNQVMGPPAPLVPGDKRGGKEGQDIRRPTADAQTLAEIDLEDRLKSIHPIEVMELSEHTSEVFMCAWNPRFTNLIATGSGDASARIWAINPPNATGGCQRSILLPHGINSADKKNKDVTTLEWSPNGELLATGSYDGVARVWSRSGELMQTLKGHRGPIFSLKWNKRGNFLLSGSYDKTTIVWDVSGEKGVVKQQFSFHFAPALDVDWKDDLTFASCSTDKTVQICRVGSNRPLKTFSGHTDEVNAVKWDPSGTLLASCSDDCTAKVWDVNSASTLPKWDFKSHQQEIYTVKWSPTGPGSKNPNKPLMLATASFDGSVRLWNVYDGSCARILSRHRESVYSVAFSPTGDYLASGSLAGQLYIWNVRDGQIIKSFKGKGDIFEVAWNIEESRVAACFSSNVVSVIDFKRP